MWCFSLEGRNGVWWTFSVIQNMYILQPHQLRAFKTIIVTLCDNEHSGDAIGAHV